MYGLVQHEAWRQSPEEIRREVAIIRLEKAARTNRERASGPLRDLSWEIAVRGAARQAPPQLRIARLRRKQFCR